MGKGKNVTKCNIFVRKMFTFSVVTVFKGQKCYKKCYKKMASFQRYVECCNIFDFSGVTRIFHTGYSLY